MSVADVGRMTNVQFAAVLVERWAPDPAVHAEGQGLHVRAGYGGAPTVKVSTALRERSNAVRISRTEIPTTPRAGRCANWSGADVDDIRTTHSAELSKGLESMTDGRTEDLENWWAEVRRQIGLVENEGISISLASPIILNNLIRIGEVFTLNPDVWDGLGDWALGQCARVTRMQSSHTEWVPWQEFLDQLGEIMPPEIRDTPPSERA